MRIYNSSCQYKWEIQKKNLNEFEYSHQDSEYLSFEHFIIEKIQFSNYRIISRPEEQNKHFTKVDDETLNNNFGILIHMKHLLHTNLSANRSQIDLFSKGDFIQEIFKAKKVSWRIESFHKLRNIKAISPESYHSFDYSLKVLGGLLVKRKKSKNIETIDLNKFAFSSIDILTFLSPDEYELVQKLLSSVRTKQSIRNIHLKFGLLSECLQILALCEECPNIEDIIFIYKVGDTKYPGIVIDKAIKRYRKKSMSICLIKITKK